MIVTILIYMLFFTSKLWISKPISKETKIGKRVEYMQDRSITLISATYDKEIETMEIVLTYENKSLDNINDYYYAHTVLEQKFSKSLLKEVYNKPLFCVLRIENIKKNYGEVKVFIAPKIVKKEDIKDSITASLVINKRNVKQGNINLKKTENEYILDRLNSLYEYQETKIAEKEKEIEEIQIEISAIENKRNTFENNREYMSDSEIADTEYELEGLEMKKLKLKEDIEEKNNELKELKKERKSLKERKEKANK